MNQQSNSRVVNRRKFAKGVIVPFATIILSGIASWLVASSEIKSTISENVYQGRFVADYIGYRYFQALTQTAVKKGTFTTPRDKDNYLQMLKSIQEDMEFLIANPLARITPESALTFAKIRNVIIVEINSERLKSPAENTAKEFCKIYFEPGDIWTNNQVKVSKDEESFRKTAKKACEHVQKK